MSQPVTREQVVAMLQTVKAVAEAIRELKQVPSGHLYTMLMDHMRNYLLIWKEPSHAAAEATH